MGEQRPIPISEIFPNLNASRTKGEILGIHARLMQPPSPNFPDASSQQFEELIRLLGSTDSAPFASDLLRDPDIISVAPTLTRGWARHEYHRERDWALTIAGSEDPSGELKKYPVYGFYEKLIPFEFSLVNALHNGKINNALFIGSGPLPLSPLLLAESGKMHVDGIDVLEEACDIATDLTKKVGLEDQVKYSATDIRDMDDLGRYDMITLATLAGETAEEKAEIFQHLHGRMKKGQMLAVRTMRGLRSLLYHEVQPQELDGFQIHFDNPSSNITNRVIVAEKK
mgnify:CR=1 FL=1